MSTHNICFIKKNQNKNKHKNIAKESFDKSFADLLFKCTLSIGGYIFYHKFSKYEL